MSRQSTACFFCLTNLSFSYEIFIFTIESMWMFDGAFKQYGR